VTAAAIFGAGRVAQALAARLHGAGISVRVGARDPSATRSKLPAELADVPVRPLADAATGADVVLLAVPAGAAVSVARAAGDLTGRTLVDCTNPVRWDEGPVWSPPAEGSVAQALARALPGVAVIKGFNHFGAEIQRDPRLADGPADAFFAGDDGDAKALVLDLATRMGFRAHDAGPLRNAALLESLAVLWIHLSSVGGVGRSFAFRLEARA